jgi:hypothetical protein
MAPSWQANSIASTPPSLSRYVIVDDDDDDVDDVDDVDDNNDGWYNC